MSCQKDTFDPCEQLKQLNSIIANRAQSDVLAYEIGGVRVRKDDVRSLLQLRQTLTAECNRAKAAAKVAAGLGNPNKIKVRF